MLHVYYFLPYLFNNKMAQCIGTKNFYILLVIACLGGGFILLLAIFVFKAQ